MALRPSICRQWPADHCSCPAAPSSRPCAPPLCSSQPTRHLAVNNRPDGHITRLAWNRSCQATARRGEQSSTRAAFAQRGCISPPHVVCCLRAHRNEPPPGLLEAVTVLKIQRSWARGGNRRRLCRRLRGGLAGGYLALVTGTGSSGSGEAARGDLVSSSIRRASPSSGGTWPSSPALTSSRMRSLPVSQLNPLPSR